MATNVSSDFVDFHLDQLQVHIVNYWHLLFHYRFILMRFVLGYIQGVTIEHSVLQHLLFCNMSRHQLSFIANINEPKFYLITLDRRIYYDDSFRDNYLIGRSDFYCKPFDRASRLDRCVTDLQIANDQTIKQIKSSCKIHQSFRPPTGEKSASLLKDLHKMRNRSQFTETERRVVETVETVNLFLLTNPAFRLQLSNNFLFFTLGHFLARYGDDSVLSIGTHKFAFGHNILVANVAPGNWSQNVVYTIIRFVLANQTVSRSNEKSNAASTDSTESVLQVDVRLEGGIGNVMGTCNVVHFETLRFHQTSALMDHLKHDDVDQMLLILTELFKPIIALDDGDLFFFVGYFFAWRIMSDVTDFDLRWFRNDDDLLFLGIFGRIGGFFPGKMCLLLSLEFFRNPIGPVVNEAVSDKSTETLAMCHVASVSKTQLCQPTGGDCVQMPRITQLWVSETSLEPLVEFSTLNSGVVYDESKSALENLKRVVNVAQKDIMNAVTSLENMTNFVSGFLRFHDQKMKLLQKNVIKIEHPVVQNKEIVDLIILYDNLAPLNREISRFIPEKCVKTRVSILSVNLNTKTASFKKNEKHAEQTNTYCTRKQKTDATFLPENGTFALMSSSTEKFFIRPVQFDDSNLNNTLASYFHIFMKNRNNTTRLMLDPMSHETLLVKESSINPGRTRVEIQLEAQGVSRHFGQYVSVSMLLHVQKALHVCPSKTTFAGQFFDSFPTEKSVIVRKFTRNSVAWHGFGMYYAKWQSFCTSYHYNDFDNGQNYQHVQLKEISVCKSERVRSEPYDTKTSALCMISDETMSSQLLGTQEISIQTEVNGDYVEISNSYLLSGIVYNLTLSQFSNFSLLMPSKQATKMNHQTMLINCSIDDIVSIRYRNVTNTKVIDVRIQQSISIRMSIDDYRNNFAFHVLRTKDDHLLILHPISQVFLKVNSHKLSEGVSAENTVSDLSEFFSVIWAEPNKSISFHISDNNLHKPETSSVINWIENDANLPTFIRVNAINWVLDIDANCSSKMAADCHMEYVHIEADTFYSTNLKLISFKALCWKLKEFGAELTIKVDPSPSSYKLNTLVLHILIKNHVNLNASTTYLTNITFSQQAKRLTKLYLEFEYIHALQHVLQGWALTPYKLDLPGNVRWLVLQPESLVRPVAYKMQAATTNFEHFRAHNSMLLRISIVPAEDEEETDHLLVLCFSYFSVSHAFPKILLEFTNEIYFVRRATPFHTFY